MLAKDLEGKTAVVTGGGKGLGRGIAVTLARSGVDVAVGDVALEAAEEVGESIRELGRESVVVRMDVASRVSVEKAFSTIHSKWGRIDILVNNAAVTGAPGWLEASEDREEDWEACLRVNLMGTMYCCKAVIPSMIARRYGKIINIGSMSGRSATERRDQVAKVRPSHFPYAVTKAGVIRYTQKLASALAQHNINVNTVCPGSLVTDLGVDIVRRRMRMEEASLTGNPDEIRLQQVIQGNLFGRELTVEDVTKVVAFLASDDAQNITGAAYHVDGGAVMV